MRIHSVPVLVIAAALAFMPVTACGPSGDDGAKRTSGTASPAATARTAAPSPAPSANGVEKLPATEILSRARKAMVAARNVRLHGTFQDEGKAMALDFRYAGPKRAVGDVTMGGQRISLVRIGRSIYLKGDDAFLRSVGGKGAVQLLAGKYLRTTSKDEGFAELAAFSDPAKFFPELLTPDGTVSKGKQEVIAGTPAIALEDGTGGKLYVATRGEPHVLRLDGGPGNRLDFDGYGTAVAITTPPAAQVVDISELKH
ncbi:hypothetical protein [Actinomadura opuntiae]|uniref:hypothetical protein n=1 Tax=Actinomadura sp. OS1-43 TaxID=604315 RepID=UPI00255AD6C4|nr:hypothetical protein [Actinomadura sp. OS1-43]MDL4814220.1 hypothetical protein [Actinomadura sp. OS1-43]